jgi:hypothetical protein
VYPKAKADYCAKTKSLIYLGKVFRQKHLQFHAAIMPPLFAWSTLDDSMYIEMLLFVLQHPKWPRKVGMAKSLLEIEKVFAGKLCQCNCHLNYNCKSVFNIGPSGVNPAQCLLFNKWGVSLCLFLKQPSLVSD